MKTLLSVFQLFSFSAFTLLAQEPSLVNGNGGGITNPAFRTAVLSGTNVSDTELGYLDGVSSGIQAQFNAKQATLVSGTNIKTLNGTSVLGSGDLTVGGTVDNATVNAAVAEDPHLTREALQTRPILFGPLGIRSLARLPGTAGLNESVVRLRVLNLGDSFTLAGDGNEAWNAYFRRAGAGGGVAKSGITSTGVVGPSGTYDWERSNNGKYFELTTGQTLILNSSRADFLKKFHVMAIQENGAGTLKIERDATGGGYTSISTAEGTGTVDGAAATNLDSINCDNAGAVDALVVSWDFATSKQQALKITGLSGTVRIWFFGWSDIYDYPNLKGGVEVYSCGTESSEVSGQQSCPQYIFDALYQTLDPHIVTWKSNDANNGTNLPLYMAKVETATGGTALDMPDFWFFGEHPNTITNNNPDTEWDVQSKEMCDYALSTYNTFVDSRAYGYNVALLNDLGLINLGHTGNTFDDALLGYVIGLFHNTIRSRLALAFPTPQGFSGGLEFMLPAASGTVMNVATASGTGSGTIRYRSSQDLDRFAEMLGNATYTRLFYDNRHYFAGGISGASKGSWGNNFSALSVPTSDLGLLNMYQLSPSDLLVKGVRKSGDYNSLLKLSVDASAQNETGTAAFEAGRTYIEMSGRGWYEGAVAPTPQTVTITIANPGVVTLAGHGFQMGTPVRFSTDGALPTGLNTATTYYVWYIDANTFGVRTARSGLRLNTTGSQSGTHTVTVYAGNGSLYTNTGAGGTLYVRESGTWVAK